MRYRLFVPHALSVGFNGQGTVVREPDKTYYQAWEPVTLAATPARWYRFANWSDGNTNNPRSIIFGTNNSFTANFIPTTPLETLDFGGIRREAPVGMPAMQAKAVFGTYVTNQVIGNGRIVGRRIRPGDRYP